MVLKDPLNMKLGDSAQEKDCNGNTRLMQACLNGDIDVVLEEVDHGCQLAEHNNAGYTPLMLALKVGHCGIASYLLDKMETSDLNKQSISGKTAMDLAYRIGNEKILEKLKDKGGKPRKKWNKLRTTVSKLNKKAKEAFHRADKPPHGRSRSASITSVSSIDERYDNCGPGKLVIFNIQKYDAPRFAYRGGSQYDKEKLVEEFKSRNYDIDCHEDLSGDEILENMRSYSKIDHTDVGSFVCCIMAHGYLGVIIGSDGGEVPLTELTSLFSDANCPSLHGKPKVFIIVSCQLPKTSAPYWDGLGTDTAVLALPESASQMKKNINDITEELRSTLVTPALVPKEEVEECTINKMLAVDKDFLVVWSTLLGSTSYRRTTFGTFFIDDLVVQIKKYGSFKSLDEILRNTAKHLSVKVLSELHPEKRQTCFFLSSLTKSFYLDSKLSLMAAADSVSSAPLIVPTMRSCQDFKDESYMKHASNGSHKGERPQSWRYNHDRFCREACNNEERLELEASEHPSESCWGTYQNPDTMDQLHPPTNILSPLTSEESKQSYSHLVDEQGLPTSGYELYKDTDVAHNFIGDVAILYSSCQYDFDKLPFLYRTPNAATKNSPILNMEKEHHEVKPMLEQMHLVGGDDKCTTVSQAEKSSPCHQNIDEGAPAAFSIEEKQTDKNPGIGEEGTGPLPTEDTKDEALTIEDISKSKTKIVEQLKEKEHHEVKPILEQMQLVGGDDKCTTVSQAENSSPCHQNIDEGAPAALSIEEKRRDAHHGIGEEGTGPLPTEDTKDEALTIEDISKSKTKMVEQLKEKEHHEVEPILEQMQLVGGDDKCTTVSQAGNSSPCHQNIDEGAPAALSSVEKQTDKHHGIGEEGTEHLTTDDAKVEALTIGDISNSGTKMVVQWKEKEHHEVKPMLEQMQLVGGDDKRTTFMQSADEGDRNLKLEAMQITIRSLECEVKTLNASVATIMQKIDEIYRLVNTSDCSRCYQRNEPTRHMYSSSTSGPSRVQQENCPVENTESDTSFGSEDNFQTAQTVYKMPSSPTSSSSPHRLQPENCSEENTESDTSVGSEDNLQAVHSINNGVVQICHFKNDSFSTQEPGVMPLSHTESRKARKRSHSKRGVNSKKSRKSGYAKQKCDVNIHLSHVSGLSPPPSANSSWETGDVNISDETTEPKHLVEELCPEQEELPVDCVTSGPLEHTDQTPEGCQIDCQKGFFFDNTSSWDSGVNEYAEVRCIHETQFERFPSTHIDRGHSVRCIDGQSHSERGVKSSTFRNKDHAERKVGHIGRSKHSKSYFLVDQQEHVLFDVNNQLLHESGLMCRRPNAISSRSCETSDNNISSLLTDEETEQKQIVEDLKESNLETYDSRVCYSAELEELPVESESFDSLTHVKRPINASSEGSGDQNILPMHRVSSHGRFQQKRSASHVHVQHNSSVINHGPSSTDLSRTNHMYVRSSDDSIPTSVSSERIGRMPEDRDHCQIDFLKCCYDNTSSWDSGVNENTKVKCTFETQFERFPCTYLDANQTDSCEWSANETETTDLKRVVSPDPKFQSRCSKQQKYSKRPFCEYGDLIGYNVPCTDEQNRHHHSSVGQSDSVTFPKSKSEVCPCSNQSCSNYREQILMSSTDKNTYPPSSCESLSSECVESFEHNFSAMKLPRCCRNDYDITSTSNEQGEDDASKLSTTSLKHVANRHCSFTTTGACKFTGAVVPRVYRCNDTEVKEVAHSSTSSVRPSARLCRPNQTSCLCDRERHLARRHRKSSEDNRRRCPSSKKDSYRGYRESFIDGERSGKQHTYQEAFKNSNINSVTRCFHCMTGNVERCFDNESLKVHRNSFAEYGTDFEGDAYSGSEASAI